MVLGAVVAAAAIAGSLSLSNIRACHTRFTAETQRARRECSYDPIPRNAGLDHKCSPFVNRSSDTSMAYGTAKNACSDAEEGFYLAVSRRALRLPQRAHRQIKN